MESVILCYSFQKLYCIMGKFEKIRKLSLTDITDNKGSLGWYPTTILLQTQFINFDPNLANSLFLSVF